MADINLTTTAVSPTTIDRDDLRTRLRQELHDEDSANYRWTDAGLNRHIDRAVRELSAVWPRERKTTAQTAAGSREVSVTLDQLVRVEAGGDPTGEGPPAAGQWRLGGGGGAARAGGAGGPRRGGVGPVRPRPAASPLGQTGKRAIWQTGPSTGLRTGRRATGQRR